MDKPDRNGTIKIQLSGKGQKQKEKQKKKKQPEETPAESKAAQNDMDKKTVPAAEESEFDWILPEQSGSKTDKPLVITTFKDKVEESSVFGAGLKDKAKNSLWNKGAGRLVLSIAVAIAIGIGFTYTVLFLTTQEDGTLPAAVSETVDSAPQKEEPAAAVDEAGKIQPLDVTIVQGGVFSSEEAAVEQSELFNAGGTTAEVIGQDGKFYILFAVSDTIEHAKRLSVEFREAGTDAFWKEMQIGGGIKGLSKADQLALKKAYALYGKTAAALTAMRFNDSADIETVRKEAEALADVKVDSEEMKQLILSLSEAGALLSDETAVGNVQKKLLQFLGQLDQYKSA